MQDLESAGILPVINLRNPSCVWLSAVVPQVVPRLSIYVTWSCLQYVGLLIKCCDFAVVSSLLGGQLASTWPWCVPGSICALPTTAVPELSHGSCSQLQGELSVISALEMLLLSLSSQPVNWSIFCLVRSDCVNVDWGEASTAGAFLKLSGGVKINLGKLSCLEFTTDKTIFFSLLVYSCQRLLSAARQLFSV